MATARRPRYQGSGRPGGEEHRRPGFPGESSRTSSLLPWRVLLFTSLLPRSCASLGPEELPELGAAQSRVLPCSRRPP